MTDSEKLARWQGYKQHPNGVSCYTGELRLIGGTLKWPDYLNDDAATMSLLDTLVEKEYWFTLDTGSERYMFNLRLGNFDIGGFYIEASGKTRREAIVAAVLEVAKRELGADEAARLEVARKELEG